MDSEIVSGSLWHKSERKPLISINLMKITGHRTEKAFLLYIKVTPEDSAQRLLEHWKKQELVNDLEKH